MILGLGQLKQWMYLLSFREENVGIRGADPHLLPESELLYGAG